jgi:serine/threonine protein kinase
MAFAGHSEAATKAKILHRDISMGNILITSDGNGILIDWELSKDLSAKTEVRVNERTVCVKAFFLFVISWMTGHMAIHVGQTTQWDSKSPSSWR